MNQLSRRFTSTIIASAVALSGVALSAGPAQAAMQKSQVNAHGSIEQVYVVEATPGAAVVIKNSDNRMVGKGKIDSLGGFVFRDVKPGDGYRVSVAGSKTSKPLTVTSISAKPPTSLYSKQDLPAPGYGYLTTRDGTKLSVRVALPGKPEDGPYPVVVEYSGYDPSNPTASLNLFQLLANAQGYAYVGVNMRGTGCSGGSFNFFEKIQSLDGYDAIETVAAQPWAGRVGMVGISYPGISQLFVAATRPPHLSAITPLSVIDDTYRGTLYPGGIYNDGFAKDWAQQRLDQNQWPNPKGAGWVKKRVEDGDATCISNLGLRGQNVDLMKTIRDNPYYSTRGIPGYPDGFDTVAPTAFINKIEVPTFIAGAWQDEQTGGHWSEMLGDFPADVPLRVTGQNGTHTDSLDPDVISRQLEFLDFYVARKIPKIAPAARGAAPQIWQVLTGVSGVSLPADRFDDFTSYKSALKAYEAEPRVRILWENGAKPGEVAGAPMPATESTAKSWPIPTAKARTFYLGSDGSLGDKRDSSTSSLTFNYEPDARPRKTYEGDGGGVWKADAVYNWVPLDSASSLSWVSSPLSRNLAIAGPGSVDLTFASTAADTDIEVTLTEVRPDGNERYVQSGWLRASHRALDNAKSTEIDPRQTHTKADASPLIPGKATNLRVALFPVAHVFKAGSRVRISVQAPGGNRTLWTFETIKPNGPTRNSVGIGGVKASRLVLSQVKSPKGLPTALAPCPSLRAQPCRTYVAPAVQTPGPALK